MILSLDASQVTDSYLLALAQTLGDVRSTQGAGQRCICSINLRLRGAAAVG